MSFTCEVRNSSKNDMKGSFALGTRLARFWIPFATSVRLLAAMPSGCSAKKKKTNLDFEPKKKKKEKREENLQ